MFNFVFMNTVITDTLSPIRLTPPAIREIRSLLEREAPGSGRALRVGVKGGGCSGLTYVLGFENPQEGDKEFVVDGIRCVMNPAHEIYLFGMEVDWQDGLNNRGFAFRNPNASTTCGCGTSFAV